MGDNIEVLYVENYDAFAELVVEKLPHEDRRLQVRTQSTAEQALDFIERNDVDCIVSSYLLPGRNGLELLADLRAVTTDVPFILFTVRTPGEIVEEAFDRGATEYLQKGGEKQYTLLANRIVNAVECDRLQRELDSLASDRLKPVK